MAQFEYDLNNKDYKLVATETNATLSGTDYIRVIILEENGNILSIPSFEEVDGVDSPETVQSIFYSSLNESPFEINVSPFGAELNQTLTKTIGGDTFNDFKIYQNPNGQIYIKPNEILNNFNISAGNYTIQIDYLNQLNESINVRFETITFNNFLTKNGHITVNGNELDSSIDRPSFLVTSSPDDTLPPNIVTPSERENVCDNLIYWSDDTISIEDIRTYFSPLQINTTDEFLASLPQPTKFEELDINGDGVATNLDNIRWIDENRPDLGALAVQTQLGNIPELPRAFEGYLFTFGDAGQSQTHTWQHIDYGLYYHDGGGFPTPLDGYTYIPNYITAIYDTSQGVNIQIFPPRSSSDLQNDITQNGIDSIPSITDEGIKLVAGVDYAITTEFEQAQMVWYPEDNNGTIPLSPNNTLGVRPFSDFYNLTPMKIELPIVQIIDISTSFNSEYSLIGEGNMPGQEPEFGWAGGVEQLEQGKYYRFVLDYPNLEDGYKIDLNILRQNEIINLNGPYTAEPENDILVDDFYRFIIREISPSRKEVRLKLIDRNINSKTEDGKEIIAQIISELTKDVDGNQLDKYQFRHKLNLGNGNHIQIMNFSFDPQTDGPTNQSIILKLYESLPNTINNLTYVTIEEEKLITQTEQIYYIAEGEDIKQGTGLTPDNQEFWLNYQSEESNFETFNELSSSITNYALDNLISQSQYNYPNLNTDYRYFKNHTHFGSAKRKLENFKTKVETIQGHYSNISKSLFAKGTNIDGDSSALIQYREDLFGKINKEVKTFTPYERFLYFDGQYESTASAPGIGKNYADTTPVNTTAITEKDIGGDGFNTTYNWTFAGGTGFSTRTAYNREIFADKYKVQDKPFFNYGSTVYLSFLMSANTGSSLVYRNNNKDINGTLRNGFILPYDAMYTSSILEPTITNNSASYQRYIFKASASYWTPNTPNNDTAELNYPVDFNPGSDSVIILTGSLKTGSSAIKDSLNVYPTTVISHSGAPFKGSIMPAGELFDISLYNTLSGSTLFGHWNFDGQTSGSNVTDAMIVSSSNVGRVGSLYKFNSAGISYSTPPIIADGVEVHGRQYGNSLQFTSQSSAGSASAEIVFDSDDYNFSRDDDFSLSIWAKRYSVHTGSADSTAGNMQTVFMKGSTEKSYGIDLDWGNNRYRAGMRGRRPDGAYVSEITVVANIPDETSGSWHHIAMTYESGSADGLKIYFDGKLANSRATSGSAWNITGSSNITSSTPLSNANKLSMGTSGVLGGTGRGFNGFLQYPRVYDRTLGADEVQHLFLQPDGESKIKISDVWVSLKNPTNVLPFDNLYKTDSTEWTSWYNGMIDSASAFDKDNIHSLQNNIPLYLQESSEHDEMRHFLALQGEQYDVIKNHIDSLSTLNDRGYKKTDSPPPNTYPMLLDNLGYQAINPFSGSLTDSLGSYLTGVTSIDDIKNNTWRKTLNNLLYVYKSKGTANSVRSLLNIYGYPPDVLKVQEKVNVSGAPQETLINDLPPTGDGIDLDLSTSTGSVGYVLTRAKLHNYKFNKVNHRTLKTDWWMDSADINTIEFVYKHVKAAGSQTILESSGSVGETLWDLRIAPDSNQTSASVEFRLSNVETGSNNIVQNALSMSTSYLTFNDGELWNIMLQRITGSTTGIGDAEYRLHVALQDGESIKTYNYTTMSVSGGLVGGTTVGGKGFFANQNWQSSGSRHYLSSSNLLVGSEMSGSLSEIKSWTTALSTSKFRKHILNKFSTVGNSIDSYEKELVYHFKLNENYSSASVSSSNQMMEITDSAPKCNLSTDYSFNISSSLFTGSVVYGFDIIDKVTLGLQDNSSFGENDNGIIINPQSTIIGDLSSEGISVLSPSTQNGDTPAPIQPSVVLDIYRSPQSTVNNFILDKLDTFNFEIYYGNPLYYHSASYTEFDDFRKEFFKCNPIEVDTNKFIKAQENIFNQSIVDGLGTTVPARSTLSDRDANSGVEIRNTLLEKQKYNRKKHSVEVNPNTATGSHLVNISLSETIYDSIKEGTAQSAPSTIGSYEVPYSASISLGNTYVTSSGYLKNSPAKNHNHPPFLQAGGYSASIASPYDISLNTEPVYDGSTVVLSKDGTIDDGLRLNKSFENVHKNWGTSSNDTHFINYSGGTGSRGDYNVGHIDTRCHFYSIGDSEYFSGSKNLAHSTQGGIKNTEFTNINNFYNQLQITDGPAGNVFYTHLHATANIVNPAHEGGKARTHRGMRMGKTRFMRSYTTTPVGVAHSVQELNFPRNHVTMYSYPFKEQMYKGTQNTNPGKLNVVHEDYSTGSFYSVTVTGGEKQLTVGGGSDPSIGSNNKIIR